MSPDKRWQMRIEHILQAIGKIQRYTIGLSFDSFAADEKTVDAVVRNFQILGEAARKVPNDVQSNYPEIPWTIMQGMRHILVHDYFKVKVDIVWRTIQTDLPSLVGPLERILTENP
jgi:uncharacterized protein with HEPN domain